MGTAAGGCGLVALVDKDGNRQLKVAILTACQDTVAAGYAHDLARLTATAGSPKAVLLFQSRGTIIPQQRAALVNAALKADATHCLWIDSDMRFPPDALGRLLSHDEPIVGCNYSTRRPPILPTAEHKEMGLVFTEADSEGLLSVARCGMGLMLVDTNVYRTIGEPYFALGFNRTENSYVGEDVFFCKKAREKGYKILIDQDLSKEVRHIGEIEFRYEHAIATREMTVGA
jgi:hypothetical protein